MTSTSTRANASTKASASTKAEPQPGTVAHHRQREAEAARQYAASAQTAAAALAALPHLEEQIESAEARVAGIERQWANGDESATVEEILAARAEVERARALIEGTKRKAEQAERSSKPTDTHAAEAVAEAVRDHAPWLEVLPTFLPPTNTSECEPVAYILQTEASTRHRGGAVGAALEIITGLPRYYRPVDVDAIVTALTHKGMKVEVRAKRAPVKLDQSEWTTTMVQAHSVWPTIPVIAATPTDADASELAHRIKNDAERLGGIKVWNATGRVLSVETNGNQRTTTVEVSLGFHDVARDEAWNALWGPRPPRRGSDLVARNAAQEATGSFAPGLGTIDSEPATTGFDPGRGGPSGASLSGLRFVYTCTSRTA